MKFLPAKKNSATKEQIQLKRVQGSTSITTKRKLTQEANNRWDQSYPAASKQRGSQVTFAPVDGDLVEDERLALNGFTTVRNGVITASPAFSRGKAQIQLEVGNPKSVSDCGKDASHTAEVDSENSLL